MPQTKQEKSITVARLKAEREKLTPHQQLRELDIRLGAGQGAYKERMRLVAQIAEAKNGQAS